MRGSPRTRAHGRLRLMSQGSPCRRRRRRTPTVGSTSTAGRLQALGGGSCSAPAWTWTSSGTSPVRARWVPGGATWGAAASSCFLEVSVVPASASFWSRRGHHHTLVHGGFLKNFHSWVTCSRCSHLEMCLGAGCGEQKIGFFGRF